MEQNKSSLSKVILIKKIAKLLFVIVLFVSISCNSNNKKESSKGTTSPSINSGKLNQYIEYLDWSKNRINKFSEEEKTRRQEVVDKIQSTSTYDSLVKNEVVSAKYIPVINLIASGITTINISGGFDQTAELVTELLELPDGEDKHIFASSTIALAQPVQGGLTKELIDLFERYRIEFNLYGEPATKFNPDGQLKHKIAYYYDFSPIFATLDPKNKKFIEAIYHAKSKGISSWNDSNSSSLQYPFMTNSREYGKKLLSVNPWSDILPEGIDNEFWSKYDPIVKERVLGLIISKDCKGLQDEFNTTADNLDKFHNADKTSSRNLDYMDFLDTQLKKLGCYEE